MKKEKMAVVSWSGVRQAWIVRYWSENSQEWLEDSAYFVQDVDRRTEYGWVSETILCKLAELNELGYRIDFKL